MLNHASDLLLPSGSKMPQIFTFRICRPFAGPQFPGIGRPPLFERREVLVVVGVKVVSVVEDVVESVLDVVAALAGPELPDGRISLARTKFPIEFLNFSFLYPGLDSVSQSTVLVTYKTIITKNYCYRQFIFIEDTPSAVKGMIRTQSYKVTFNVICASLELEDFDSVDIVT